MLSPPNLRFCRGTEPLPSQRKPFHFVFEPMVRDALLVQDSGVVDPQSKDFSYPLPIPPARQVSSASQFNHSPHSLFRPPANSHPPQFNHSPRSMFRHLLIRVTVLLPLRGSRHLYVK